VESVTWNDAQEFIKKLNEKEKGKGYQYRLPTEAEWEYACRGGATSEVECMYHFYFAKPTNDLSSIQANFNGGSPFGEADKGPYLGRTTKVGSYPPNKVGLHDMHGNVWQWCEDLWEKGASTHVYRGGGWSSGGESCRAWNRYGDARVVGGEGVTIRTNLGFRLVRVPVR
jgi:formylglycine-generating enzyme required for sulfatase activity